MSVISGTIAAIKGSQSQDKATKTNAQNAKDTNLSNMIQQLVARGITIDVQTARRLGLPDNLIGKSSAVLPYYLSDTEMRSSNAAAKTVEALQNLYGTPKDEYAVYDAMIKKYGPAIANNTNLVNDLASGRLTDQSIAESQPVFSQRLAGVEAGRRASLEALSQTLNEIDAIQAGKGFSGDSTGNRQLRFNARRQIGTSTSNSLNDALLQNAMEKRALQDQGRTLRLNNLNLPVTMAGSQIDLAQMPTNAVAKRFNASMAPLSTFNIGPHDFTPFQSMPLVQPKTSTGEIIANGAASVGNAALNQYLQMQLQKQANNLNATRTSSNNVYNPYYSPTGYNAFNTSAAAASSPYSTGYGNQASYGDLLNTGGGSTADAFMAG